jgi:hypothetical protein
MSAAARRALPRSLALHNGPNPAEINSSERKKGRNMTRMIIYFISARMKV